MDTILKKKGRIAMAWVVIVTMIFATLYTPFALAKPAGSEPTPTTPNVTIYGFGQYTPGGTTTTLPSDTDFIFFKQGSAQSDSDNQQMYIWTKNEITTSSLKADIFAYLKYHDPSINKIEFELSDVEFIYGFGDPIGDTPYSVTQGDDGLVVKWLSGKLSHLDYGQYDQEFTITVNKLVTLNEDDSINGINGTVYVSLYSDAAFTNRLATKSITISDGIAVAPAVFKVNATGTYFVRESLNMNGDVLPSPTTLFGGYTLDSVEVDPANGIDVTLTSTNVVNVTNNLSFNPKGSADVTATKEINGTDRAPGSGEFLFSLTQMTDDHFATVMTNGHAQTASNVAGGNISFESIGYESAGTYYYLMKEIIPDDAVNGYKNGLLYDDSEIRVTIEVEMVGEGAESTLKTTVSYSDVQGATIKDPTFTNIQQYGQISVVKKVELTGDILNPVNGTFYAGLFTMNEEEEFVPVMFGDDKAIVELIIENSVQVPGVVKFEGLDLYKTYYVFETDKTGAIIETDGDGYILPKNTTGWYALAYDFNEITLDPQNLTKETTITNYFADYEAPYDPSVKVIKTVTVNNKPTTSNLTFYAGLFSDPKLTKESLLDVQPLEMKGSATATAYFLTYKDSEGVPQPLKAGAKYYIAETDIDGNPLAGTAKELGFEITLNGIKDNNATVVLIEDETVVNIVNNFKKEEFPLTGDNSNMNLWIFLAMLGVAGAIAPFAFRKKEEAND